LKKLILNELVFIILVLGVFSFCFSILDGWGKSGQERCDIVIISVIVTAIFIVITAFLVVDIDETVVVFTGFIAVATSFAFLALTNLLIPLIVLVAGTGFVVFVFFVDNREGIEGAPSWAACISLGIEGAIILAVILKLTQR